MSDREQVALLFSDIEGSTALVGRLGDVWLELLAAQRRVCRTVWSAWNGNEMGTEGDSFFVVFTDPADAVFAALAVQEAIAAEPWPMGEQVRIRIGIHTGAAIRHEDGYVGLDVHRAARVSGAAHGGQTLISGDVAQAVQGHLGDDVELIDLGEHRLKDIPEPERLVQVARPGLERIFPPPRSAGAARLGMSGIGDYRFVRALAEHAGGGLYVAVPPDRLGAADHVCVKVTLGTPDDAAARRAGRELQAFSTAASPYLIRLLDAGTQNGAFFFAMEYCEGGSLAAPIESTGRSQALTVVAQASRATHALHEVGVVHRAIKPSNVLLRADGARLSDLGLVQALNPTQTMSTMGNVTGVDYVEPGMLLGKSATRATDIWSLGCTLHWALTGGGVFGQLPADDPLFAVRRVLGSRPVLDERLTESDAAAIAWCLEPEPEGRPQTALELAERLESLI